MSDANTITCNGDVLSSQPGMNDRRPLVPFEYNSDEELKLWVPTPLREGDPVYCCGVIVGTFHGDNNKPSGSWLNIAPTEELPPKLAEKYRRMRTVKAGLPVGLAEPNAIPQSDTNTPTPGK
jgi:hypothetical protein